jgi:hypothetical protein
LPKKADEDRAPDQDANRRNREMRPASRAAHRRGHRARYLQVRSSAELAADRMVLCRGGEDRVD